MENLRATHRWHPRYRDNPLVIILSIWWLIFAAISFYWAAGGMWLIDTAVQQEGIDLAHERPAWIVLLVLATGVVKLLPVLFGYLLVAPVGRVIPWILYALGGIGAGVLSMAYGVLFTIPGIRYMLNGGAMTTYGWMRLLVWMPQFWVGGLLLVLVTIVFLVHKPWRVDKEKQ